MASSLRAHALERYDSSARWGARYRFRLPCVDSSAAEARRRTSSQLSARRTPEEARDHALLVMSELVTNALRHTPSTSVCCELRLNGTLLRIAVSGAGTGPEHGPGCAGGDDEHGRGLLLVVALSEGWGVRRCDTGHSHTVWADLAHHGTAH